MIVYLKHLVSEWMGKKIILHGVKIICVWKYRKNVKELKQKAASLENILPIVQDCASKSYIILDTNIFFNTLRFLFSNPVFSADANSSVYTRYHYLLSGVSQCLKFFVIFFDVSVLTG